MPKTVKKTGRPGALGRPVNAGCFTAENPRPGPGRGKKKPVAGYGAAMLADMDRAYTDDEKPTDSAAVKRFRKLAQTDLGKFSAMYVKAMELAVAYREQESEGRVAAAATAGSAGPQEVTVMELIERLKREWAEEDARDAPTA